MEKPGHEHEPFTVFLDRDGVFDVAPRIVLMRYRSFRWLPGARDALARLNQPHIRTCLATNQPYVGAGLLPRPALNRLHRAMVRDLEAAGGRLDHVEVAAAPPLLRSRRRKPRPGLLEDGARALQAKGWPFSKSRAVMVGDRITDAQAAAAFGIPAILVATTEMAAQLEAKVARLGLGKVAVVGDVPAAVQLILQRAG